VRNRGSSFFLRIGSLVLISLAAVVAVFQLVSYSRLRGNYPYGLTVARVTIGGLDPLSARQRLLQVYSVPVEMYYGESIIQLDPALVGFELNVESMLAAADLQRTGASFWGGFWNYLWNRQSSESEIPLVASVSPDRLREYFLTEIVPRYDQPPTPAQPIPGSTEFTPGNPGLTLDVERAVIQLEDALRSPTERTFILSTQRTAAGRPSLQNMEVLLQQILATNDFAGVAGIYLLDLQTGEEIHFGYLAGNEIPVNPDIAFSASSTIKIPIMVSVYEHFGGQLDEQTANLIREMIQASNNDASDALMKIIDPARGPLVVTEKMHTLGMVNTFMSGFFALGSPLLQFFETPANQRLDVTTFPEVYSQTTPSDMGAILSDIYLCAQSNGGALLAAFPGRLTQEACRLMVEYLKEDKIGVLIQAGVPEGTAVAHKHGWTTYSGIIQDVSDAAIVYTPGGNYVLSIYIYDTEIIWPNASLLYAELSRAVYNYFNLPGQ